MISKKTYHPGPQIKGLWCKHHARVSNGVTKSTSHTHTHRGTTHFCCDCRRQASSSVYPFVVMSLRMRDPHVWAVVTDSFQCRVQSKQPQNWARGACVGEAVALLLLPFVAAMVGATVVGAAVVGAMVGQVSGWQRRHSG